MVEITPTVILEVQALVDDGPGPDALIGRDFLTRASSVLSIADFIISLGDLVLGLHSSASECMKNTPFPLPDLQVRVASPATIAADTVECCVVYLTGSVHTRNYVSCSLHENPLLIPQLYELSGWLSHPDPVQILKKVYVQNSSDKTIELDESTLLGSPRPTVTTTASCPRPAILADFHGQQEFIQTTDPSDLESAPKESDLLKNRLAFPYEQVDMADEGYHEGSCLVPRTLTQAEDIERKESVRSREAHWLAHQDDLFDQMTIGPLRREPGEKFKNIILKYRAVWGKDLNCLRTGITPYMAYLRVKDDSVNMYTPPKNYNLLISAATTRYCELLRKARICEFSYSRHACNTFCVAKKEKLPNSLDQLGDLTDLGFLKTYRIVHSFLELNKNLVVSNNTVASLCNEVQNSKSNQIYSQQDLWQGFFQTVVHWKCRDLLAFHGQTAPSTTVN